MNLILERTDQVEYFTNLREVFDALGMDGTEYDWYVSDIETNINVPDLDPCGQRISGIDLNRLITQNEIQFIWGVFSAVEIGKRFEVDTPPYADGNPEFWRDQGPCVQLNEAIFEIVCWDSSATLLIAIPEMLGNSFCRRYTDTKALSNVKQ